MSTSGADQVPLRLGVLVPCRDEERVIERKLKNLGLVDWPAGEHRLVVVDDGSTDGTAAKAEACIAEVFGRSRGAPEGKARVRAQVISNRGTPGKPGALREGLAVLGGEVDLVVLQDADVVIGPRALLEIEGAFASDPELAMGCGSQHFVRSLSGDGRLRDGSAGPPVSVRGAYDGITAWIRRLESRAGALFSVHGQLLAWRAALGLAPRSGVAADDLDLMFQVRTRSAPPRHVRLLRGAEFFEVKEVGARGNSQALRRTRAWFGFVPAASRALGGEAPRLFRMQARLYGVLPQAVPVLVVAAVLALAVLLLGGVGTAWMAERFGAWGGPGPRLLLFLALAASILLPVARRSRLLWRARALERKDPMGDRWDMVR